MTESKNVKIHHKRASPSHHSMVIHQLENGRKRSVHGRTIDDDVQTFEKPKIHQNAYARRVHETALDLNKNLRFQPHYSFKMTLPLFRAFTTQIRFKDVFTRKQKQKVHLRHRSLVIKKFGCVFNETDDSDTTQIRCFSFSAVTESKEQEFRFSTNGKPAHSAEEEGVIFLTTAIGDEEENSETPSS